MRRTSSTSPTAALSIISIEPDAKDSTLVRICVGPPKRRVGTLHTRDADALGLAVGAAWTPTLAEAFDEALLMTAARRRVHRWLNARPMTKTMLLERLAKPSASSPALTPDIRDRLLAELESAGLIDDSAYARTLVEHERGRKPAGERLLRDKLARKGVDAKTIESTLAVDADAEDARDPRADAMELGRATLAKLRPSLDTPSKARRLFGVLARRGFDEHTAEETVRSLLGDALDEA